MITTQFWIGLICGVLVGLPWLLDVVLYKLQKKRYEADIHEETAQKLGIR